MEFLFELGLFFFKALTIVLAIVAIVLTIAAASKGDGTQHGLKLEKLNDKYREMADKVREAVLSKDDWRAYTKQRKKDLKKEEKQAAENPNKRVFVLDFKGDMRTLNKKVTMRLHSRRIEWKILTNPMLSFGEGYMDEEFSVVEGDIRDLLHLVT